MGLNDEAEKLRQADEWLRNCDITSQQWRAAWEHIIQVCGYCKDDSLFREAQRIAGGVLSRNGVPMPYLIQRGGAGRNGDGTWPPTDGRGCPLCGQIRGGGHGGGCTNTLQYDEDGNAVT